MAPSSVTSSRAFHSDDAAPRIVVQCREIACRGNKDGLKKVRTAVGNTASATRSQYIVRESKGIMVGVLSFGFCDRGTITNTNGYGFLVEPVVNVHSRLRQNSTHIFSFILQTGL